MSTLKDLKLVIQNTDWIYKKSHSCNDWYRFFYSYCMF